MHLIKSNQINSLYAILGLLLFFSSQVYSQNLEVFSLRIFRDTGKGFVSFSDIQRLSEHTDSSAIPDLEYESVPDSNYFELGERYHQLFFQQTGINPADTLYLFNYENAALKRIPISALTLKALINIYVWHEEEWPFSQYDYMIGFEIDEHFIPSASENNLHVFVAVGSKNPFQLNGLVKVKWDTCSIQEFPIGKYQISVKLDQWSEAGILKTCLKYSSDSLDYFLLPFEAKHGPLAKRLVVVNRLSADIIFDKMYYEGESAKFSPYLEQWTGKLFKNQPHVIFGMQSYSFGCPGIYFIEKTARVVPIHCDNRH